MSEDLTEREEQVIRLVAQGWTNKAKARELEISPDRVKAIVHQISVKLEAENRTEASVRRAQGHEQRG